MENIEKSGKVMNMEGFTIGNKDDINSAIEGLGRFCHSFCMNCEETEKANDLVFRCKECPYYGYNEFGSEWCRRADNDR